MGWQKYKSVCLHLKITSITFCFFRIRRFGSRTTKDIVNQDEDESPSSSTSIVRKSKVQPSTASSSLLKDIRERKREQCDFVVTTTNDRPRDNDDNDEDKSDDEGFRLIRDLKDYLHIGTSIPGKATTAEIIDHFQTRLDGKPGLVPKFKSLLKEIASLERAPSGIGFWVLKEEFRGK